MQGSIYLNDHARLFKLLRHVKSLDGTLIRLIFNFTFTTLRQYLHVFTFHLL